MKLVNIKFDVGGRGGLRGWRRGIELFGILWCLEFSNVYVQGQRYLDRKILYAFGGTLRLHKFWRGDEDSASHTHPWNFWTFPLASYVEKQYHHGVYMTTQVVEKFRWHKRSCHHEHIVIGRTQETVCPYVQAPDVRPFWTIVITGPKINDWGFYPFENDKHLLDEPRKFVFWRDYHGPSA